MAGASVVVFFFRFHTARRLENVFLYYFCVSVCCYFHLDRAFSYTAEEAK